MDEKNIKNDILFQIDMQLYDEFNDTIATMNDHLGDIYSLRDVEEVEKAERDKEIKLLREAIKKQQKELEPIKKLNIPVETLVSEFNRLEDLEDNTEMLKSELEKKNAVIYKMAEQLEKEIEWHYSEFDNYTKQDFIKHFTNLVEKENK